MNERTTESCRLCGSDDLNLFLDLGEVALAGSFLTEEEIFSETKYPLRLLFCSTCGSVQIKDVIEPKTLFSSYFYRSSQIAPLAQHFEELSRYLFDRFLNNDSGVLEIGCNDGVFLRPMAQNNLRLLVGIDPAENIEKASSELFERIVDFFSLTAALKLKERYGTFDLIVANNVFAHMPDIVEVTSGIRELLGPDGVFVFEVHDLSKIIIENQFDMIYHEHIFYHSIVALSNLFGRLGLLLFDVERIANHGGSLRCFVGHKTNRFVDERALSRVRTMIAEESDQGLGDLQRLKSFGKRCVDLKHELIAIVRDEIGAGRVVAGYGASGRAGTILQYCGLSRTDVEYIVDDAQSKHGFLMPGIHTPIVAVDHLRISPPDVIIVLAWPFREPIIEKIRRSVVKTVKIIIPLPKIEIIKLELD